MRPVVVAVRVVDGAVSVGQIVHERAYHQLPRIVLAVGSAIQHSVAHLADVLEPFLLSLDYRVSLCSLEIVDGKGKVV